MVFIDPDIHSGRANLWKGIKDDLTPKEKMVLRKINAEW
jgi:hypothetical protein